MINLWGPFRFTKVDIEGSEYELFKNSIPEGLGHVSFELHNYPPDKREPFKAKYAGQAHMVDAG